MFANPPESPSHPVRDGLAAAWPICLGYLPIGLSFGVLAQNAGLAPWQVALMSALVFAGSSQFVGVAMLSVGASTPAIIGTTFMVNLRHLLMSSALSVHLQGASRRFLALFGYGVTDESFAVNTARFRDGAWHRLSALTVNQTTNAAWFVSTVAGCYVGQFIPPGLLGIDFALTGMFICLIVFQLRSMLFVLTGLLSAVISLACYLLLPGNGYVIIAACLAATLGFMLKRRMRRREVAP